MGTFTGGWHRWADVLIFEVNELFAVFWIVFIIGINFATMRIIAAIFLKQTMAVANLDDQRMAIAKTKEREIMAEKLLEIFTKADTSGDGLITWDEFHPMMADERIMACFETMEIFPEE